MSKSNDEAMLVAPPPPPPPFDPTKPSTPISFPIKTLQDLKSRSYFDSFHFSFNRSSVPLRRNTGALPDRSRILVCHDMKGGYVDDKWVQGCGNNAGYAIWHWYLMDVFVYFAHSLVTLPPPCWTNTAHRHGVKVLGTFITEWDEGKAICKELLATKESAQMYAERLAELAAALGFDGWLMNIENVIDEAQIPNLMVFVSHLTKVMHSSVPGGLVIWYDSVTVHGLLAWQDQLTENNKPFFDICDGIFMNYTWKENYPKASAEIAGDRKYDVYMGIDVFGRGTYGGGQWTTNVALDVLKRDNVSAAIFAPGWVYESEQPPDFYRAQNKWWSLVEKSWGRVQTYPQVLPFYADFDLGLGSHISLGGQTFSDAPWYNISCQNLQPLLEFHEGSNIMQVTVDGREASYNGGGNVCFRGKLKRNEHFTARLFKPQLQLSASPISISFSVKSDTRSELSILLQFSSPSNETKSLLMAPNDSISRVGNMFLPCHLTSTQTKSDWTVHETNLVLDGYTLTEISAFCSTPDDLTEEANTLEYFALLGHISIKSQQKTKLFPLAIEAHDVKIVPGDPGSKTLSCKLEWRLKHPKEDFTFTRYNVYAEDLKSSDYRPRKVMEERRIEKVFLGTAHVNAYYVSELVVGSDVKGVRFVVQPCGEDGTWQELDASPNLLVEIERPSSKLCCCGLI
ncbi:PREDICTED: cytosolic endo-beta-N-acetylglucosaminidase 1 [Camelina sativa]|uniref:mannosyl-glycoprotein endo-beta-N-acetylglucosaminidase n=1 Tax=Camelina sativa TaxID=90675 RepID=A0ABM0TAW8_CAMSA|nr:PREDICTED: cytosolic endo-beta-N-acetylglucosaminidase 1 [Camelina sativa]